ncbi:MAG: type I DNA topoisomerase [Chthonomonas sp.]|nr:type I DNA topoisomerase [Chthonomonas sp.]
MSKLVIVESPAKAKTISRFLGGGYIVEASFGHVRDLPNSATEVPAEYKKLKWGKLGVNVDDKFQPLYVVPADKKRHVDNLKKAAKGADEILLATDEDREGESISWHILELLKLPKSAKVSRIVFHEVTPEAIKAALANPRQLDDSLVRAQETRRILDRLYGYTLSPLLWKKVAPKLSAGRVQSVAVRLLVDRERERRDFIPAQYWDLSALFGAKDGEFDAQLVRLGDQKIATGKSFSDRGLLIDKSVWLKEEDARTLGSTAKAIQEWKVSKVEAKPGQESPPKPFQTSTLQQEANRKLRLSSKRTMQIAQNLYEGVDLGGERVGLITYMRTDSMTLSERALQQAREVIKDLYGANYLPPQAVQYKTKSKGAQEAHEAIRPTDLSRRPQDIKQYLSPEQYDLYELIWKRTIACQMVAARVLRTSAEVEGAGDGKTFTFSASGKSIEFPGFLRAYVEGSDDPDSELGDRERILPVLTQGQSVDLRKLEVEDHATRPPARYTEASLVGKLEEEGIGRPSTYASIISTIQDRGYTFKRGNELVPTFTAFAVTDLLAENFEELVDLKFTARMEDELDEIAEGKRDSVKHLRNFYSGDHGLDHQVSAKSEDIPYPAIPIGNDITLKVGRFGTYIQRGDQRASVPEGTIPADFDVEKAEALLGGPAAVGVDAKSGQKVLVKSGRFGTYLEVAQTEEEKESGEKPRRASLPNGVRAEDLTEEDMQILLSFPRELGAKDGAPVTVLIGRYGPFVKSGDEIRNIADWRVAGRVTLQEAIEILAQPKAFGKRSTSREPAAALQEFGKLEGAQGNVRVLSGRYGPYVTDGKTNATLPKHLSPESITADQALELLKAKAAAGPSKKKPFRRGRKSA